MCRRLRSSSVTYPFRYASSSRLADGHFERNDVIIICETVHSGCDALTHTIQTTHGLISKPTWRPRRFPEGIWTLALPSRTIRRGRAADAAGR